MFLHGVEFAGSGPPASGGHPLRFASASASSGVIKPSSTLPTSSARSLDRMWPSSSETGRPTVTVLARQCGLEFRFGHQQRRMPLCSPVLKISSQSSWPKRCEGRVDLRAIRGNVRAREGVRHEALDGTSSRSCHVASIAPSLSRLVKSRLRLPGIKESIHSPPRRLSRTQSL